MKSQCKLVCDSGIFLIDLNRQERLVSTRQSADDPAIARTFERGQALINQPRLIEAVNTHGQRIGISAMSPFSRNFVTTFRSTRSAQMWDTWLI